MTALVMFIVLALVSAVESALRERAEKLKLRRLELEYKLRQLERNGVRGGPHGDRPPLEQLPAPSAAPACVKPVVLYDGNKPFFIHVTPCTYDGAGVCVKCNRPEPTTIPSSGVLHQS